MPKFLITARCENNCPSLRLCCVMVALTLAGTFSYLFPLKASAQETPAIAEMPEVTHLPKVFHRLWGVYPNKEGKEAAIQAWNKLQVSEDELYSMRLAFPMWISSGEWEKEKGKHVPPLSQWLGERMWEKDPPPPAPLRIAEASSFLIEPIYLVPRLVFAISGAFVAGIVWPFDQELSQRMWDTSIGAPWAWHDFIDPR